MILTKAKGIATEMELIKKYYYSTAHEARRKERELIW